MQGRHVTVTLKTGARFSGILSGVSTSTPDIGCTLKWARQIRAATGSQDPEPNAEEYIGGGPEKTMVFQSQDLAEIYAEKVTLGESAGGLKTAHNGMLNTIRCWFMILIKSRRSGFRIPY